LGGGGQWISHQIADLTDWAMILFLAGDNWVDFLCSADEPCTVLCLEFTGGRLSGEEGKAVSFALSIMAWLTILSAV